jgi:hypothetical protein
VGIASSGEGVKKRFNDRIKALRDLGVDLRQLQNRTVDIFTITGSTPCIVNRRKKNTKVIGTPVTANADLLLLEQFLIHKLATYRHGRGNLHQEGVVRAPSKPNINASFAGPGSGRNASLPI